MFELSLYFSGSPASLESTCSRRLGSDSARRAMRGRNAGRWGVMGVFPWTSAVQALTLLLVRYKLDQGPGPHLSGGKDSPAATLDYALTKEPAWLSEILGADRTGCPYLKQSIIRMNSERKRPGPVVLWVNEKALPRPELCLYREGKPLQEDGLRELERDLRSL